MEPPKLDIYDFKGLFKIEIGGGEGHRESLSLENTLWCNTYLATGSVIGIVIYIGKETRSVMNTKAATPKFGKIDMELNHLAKILFCLMICLSVIIVFVSGEKRHVVI